MTMTTADTIDGSGFPLGFRYRDAAQRSTLISGQEGSDTILVDCRALGDHQKEAMVTEGSGGAVWRMTSDEGPYLQGTDLAPFPLGFFNIGLQADLINRLYAIAKIRNINITHLAVELDNIYAFSGSFFKGTGQGTAEGVEIRISINSTTQAAGIRALIEAAMKASPAFACLQTPLKNAFAIYVNGKRGEVVGMLASNAADVDDPFKKYLHRPVPAIQAGDQADIITKIPFTSKEEVVSMPSETTKVGLRVKGESQMNSALSGVQAQSTLEKPVGSKFGFQTDEFNDRSTAPAGIAYLSAGIAFCYMTQLLRYAQYLKYNISHIRMAQISPFRLTGSLQSDNLEAHAEPVQTHLFLNGSESQEVMQNLLTMGAKTCYLHAALSATVKPQVKIVLNGLNL